MKVYISHKRVKAAQIAGVFAGSDTVQTVDGEIHKVPGLFARSTPSVGDYLVEYDDGYRSHSPKAAFEGGYRLVGSTLEVAHQDGTFTVGFSNGGEAGGFTTLGDITDQIPFIGSVVTTDAPTDGLSFGDAIAALKAGKRVARGGWNGKGMWLGLVTGCDYHGLKGSATVAALGCTKLPWIGLKTADNSFAPWNASQADVLAEDWSIVG